MQTERFNECGFSNAGNAGDTDAIAVTGIWHYVLNQLIGEITINGALAFYKRNALRQSPAIT
jgi:hypothetical protein